MCPLFVYHKERKTMANDNGGGNDGNDGNDGMDNGNGASDDDATGSGPSAGATDVGSFGGSVSAVDGSQGQGQSQGPGSPGSDAPGPGNTDVSGNAPSDGTGASVDSNTIGGAPTMSFTGSDASTVGQNALGLVGAGLAAASGNPKGMLGGLLGGVAIGVNAATPGTALSTAIGHATHDIGILGAPALANIDAARDADPLGIGIHATESQTIETGAAQPNDMSFLTDLGFVADPPPAAAPAPQPVATPLPIAAPLPAPVAIAAAGPVAVNNYHALLNLGFVPN
jgi:hypothetical protein